MCPMEVLYIWGTAFLAFYVPSLNSLINSHMLIELFLLLLDTRDWPNNDMFLIANFSLIQRFMDFLIHWSIIYSNERISAEVLF